MDYSFVVLFIGVATVVGMIIGLRINAFVALITAALVFLTGLEEGLFPSQRTVEEGRLDEERRLAYVAWTRARKSLLLVYDPYASSVFMREAFSEDELAGHLGTVRDKAA
jgi:uncharacterized protein YneF (UPF0154 family)